MASTFAEFLPADPAQSLDRFLDAVSARGLSLYPAQEEAILELHDGKNLILNTPTGSGKSLVASAAHFQALAQKRRSVYTSPIKALVNEKFLALCQDFGADRVGMVTGDASVNRDAPILCCTAEILANIALREGARAGLHDVVMDEFHYYSDRERGVAWQLPLLTLSQCRFTLMSATLGDTSFFEEALTRLNGKPTAVVRSVERPVPLEFKYSEVSIEKAIQDQVEQGRAPVYVVNFTQRDCADLAQSLLSVDYCSKDEKRLIAEALEGVKFSSPYGKDFQRILRHGVGLHHAGLLPRYRVLVERLAQKGLLKIICGTDTLGVGVNVPIRTVLFTKLCKYDGEKTAILSARDFHQISGRAGRKGFDDQGYVVAQAPEHVIENLKIAADPKKAKKAVKKKPPEKGFVNWDKTTFERLMTAPPEALVSRFQVSHSLVLNVLAREEEDGCEALKEILRSCHETDYQKKKLGRTAFELFRSLVERKIIEILPLPRTGPEKVRVHADLQEDFSLNHALSLYLVDTIALLDRESPDYAADLLTLVESILENPDLILQKQLFRARDEKMAELKAQGMDFDDRILELEKVEYPKPCREFVYATYNEFAAKHPWVGQENIRPKSVAREMFEMFMSFAEYVRDYDLQRAEGILLRYLSQAYKVLAQTVPDASKTDEVWAMQEYLGTLVRTIDASLVEEWERLRGGAVEDASAAAMAGAPAGARVSIRALEIAIRNEVFRVVRALSARRYEEAAELLGSDPAWGPDALKAALEPYFASGHARIQTNPEARSAKHARLAELGGGRRSVEQVLVDPDGANDWSLKLEAVLEGAEVRLKLIEVSEV